GRGKQRAQSICGDSSDPVSSLVPLPARGVLVATTAPCLTRLGQHGNVAWTHRYLDADFRNQQRNFAISADGTIVDFEFEVHDKSRLRFDVRNLALSSNPTDVHITQPPKQAGVSIERWMNSSNPTVDGKPIIIQ